MGTAGARGSTAAGSGVEMLPSPTLVPREAASDGTTPPLDLPNGRSSTQLREGWRFFAGEAAGAEQPGFDDVHRRLGHAGWQDVVVRHTWNAQDRELIQEPLVHITSRRFEPRTTANIDIEVYSNLPRASLHVNGSDVSELASSNHIFRAAGVPLLQGVNQVEVVGRDAGSAAITMDRVSWSR